MGERIAAELRPLGLDPSKLREFPPVPGTETHFVVGEDKRGVLWTLEFGFVDATEQRVFGACRFHGAARHMGEGVHGGATSAIIDAFAAICGMIQLGWNMRAVTREQTIRFLLPLRIETTYLVIARSGQTDREAGTAEVFTEFLDQKGTTRVAGHTTMVVPKR